ncbi:MAG: hypothetical protein KDA31_08355 [Phycisphaerales bacterium]|nr:hypothetical protein [Phycisphaerales bacterium]MCB9835922.1 hypothetical protein [Phycisphaera sp.]
MRLRTNQIVATLISISAGPSCAQPCSHTETGTLLPPDANTIFMGSCSATSGNVLIVGAPKDNTNGLAAGAAHIYRRVGSSWVYEDKLLAVAETGDDEFGAAVAIDGDIAVVGASLDSDPDGRTYAGSAYVFEFDGVSWNQSQKLIAPDQASFDRFGYSVAISGDSILIGSPFDSDNGQNSSGSVYVFTREGAKGWVFDTKLHASDPRQFSNFGDGIAVSGDTAIIAASRDREIGIESGAAYIFRRDASGWSEQTKLQSNDIAADDRFGYSVAISGDAIMVGAPGEDSGGEFAGAAYAFRFNGTNWTQEDKMRPTAITTGDVFGTSVAIQDDLVIVGSISSVIGGLGDGMGSAYVYRYTGFDWDQEDAIIPAGAVPFDWFGASVSLAGDTAFIGAPFTLDAGMLEVGKVFVFDLGCLPCIADTNGDGMLSPADFSAWIAAFNTMASECDQNGDGICSPADFSAWVANYNAGC